MSKDRNSRYELILYIEFITRLCYYRYPSQDYLELSRTETRSVSCTSIMIQAMFVDVSFWVLFVLRRATSFLRRSRSRNSVAVAVVGL